MSDELPVLSVDQEKALASDSLSVTTRRRMKQSFSSV